MGKLITHEHGDIIMPGRVLDYHGREAKVGMVGSLGGERYYWLVFLDGSIAMLPATEIERKED
jgi:hypothetical protein